MTTDTKPAPAPAKETALAPRFDMEKLIEKAIERDDVAVLERVLDLAKRVKDENARDAYNAAMADFQKQCPTILKTRRARIRTKDNREGPTYTFAGLGDILPIIQPIMGELGLSVSWRQRFHEGFLMSNCRISHVAGHFEESGEVPVAIPQESSGATGPQRTGSAQSYGRRYSLLAIAGIMPEDEDEDDGAGGDERTPGTVQQPQRKSEKAPAAAASASKLPKGNPWTGNLDEVRKTAEPDVDLWVLHADGGVVVFYTMLPAIKDRAAEAISNARQVSIAWAATAKGNAEVKTLTVLMDA